MKVRRPTESDPAHRDAWRTYIAASIPGWTVAAVAALLLHRTGGISALAAILVVLLWIGTDLAKFPRVRRYYTSEPPTRGMLGRIGVAVSPLTPDGVVRVGGELWHGSVLEPHAPVEAGVTVRVCAVNDLQLIVEPRDTADPASRE